MMLGRYNAVKAFIRSHPDHPVLKPLPFNSGYFMSFHCSTVDAEALRQELLFKHGIGTISLGPHYLRVAFSGIDEELLTGVYETIYDAAAQLSGED
jgi:hypothetical protein